MFEDTRIILRTQELISRYNIFVASNNWRFYMEELLNKELTYGQLTRGVLKEEPKKGNSKKKPIKNNKNLCVK